jgi:hypothetical protein
MDSIVSITLELILLVLLAGVVWYFLFRSRGTRGGEINIHSSLEGMRSVGELAVFKAFTKEIVTEVDHSWGEFGRKYLDWIYSSKKMAMIFEFALVFRYDLRGPDFEIADAGNGSFVLKMPPCLYDVNIRNIEFYDEQHSKLLPWLLPDLLNGFLGGGFTEEHRNRLVTAARAHAEDQARQLIGSLSSEVESSARQTLEALGRAFGAKSIRFEFRPANTDHMEVSIDKAVRLAA